MKFPGMRPWKQEGKATTAIVSHTKKKEEKMFARGI